MRIPPLNSTRSRADVEELLRFVQEDLDVGALGPDALLTMASEYERAATDLRDIARTRLG